MGQVNLRHDNSLHLLEKCRAVWVGSEERQEDDQRAGATTKT